jgi:hypothetical protein
MAALDSKDWAVAADSQVLVLLSTLGWARMLEPGHN